MTGRFASHVGLQHSYLETEETIGLPLKFKTLGDHFQAIGYETHAVGKWHLGFYEKEYLPTHRGWSSYFGYLSGGEDYYTHKTSGFLDFVDGNSCAKIYNGNYSTDVFTDHTIQIFRNYSEKLNHSDPFFVYLAFQAVHSPLEAPDRFIEQYSWIKNEHRRILAGMVASLDYNLERLFLEARRLRLAENMLTVLVSDNGGPTYVANSNWPMRGGKWTMWEGGTHLTAFVHHGGNGSILPQGTSYNGLFHHCDWLPTLLDASNNILNDTVEPPVDGISLWKALQDSSNKPDIFTRDHILLNVDQTNQITINDENGWSGYAGLVVLSPQLGHFKLVIGTPGVPNSWCWPNQNVSLKDPVYSNESGTIKLSFLKKCETLPGFSFPGHDLLHNESIESVERCCDACKKNSLCKGWTFRAENGCWLKSSIYSNDMQTCNASVCVSGNDGTHPLPRNSSSPVMPDPSHLTCSFSGHIPSNRTGLILFDLKADPLEKVNIAAERSDVVMRLQGILSKYIHSAVNPLNELPAQRAGDAQAKVAASAKGCWFAWK